ncbi:MAG TPA: hypothetical protein VEF04_03095 [Blastocatellia bacterium]|nr:hypothetical protein [Blastocatellia bacterium]
MNEHKLSAMLRFQEGYRKATGITGTLLLAARFFKHGGIRTDKLSGAARKRANWNRPRKLIQLEKGKPAINMLIGVRLPQHRVKRGNPARNPTALA